MAAVETSMLSKKYVQYPSPKYLFKEFFGRNENVAFDEKWAIKDVDISVPHGQTCAFIGKNGSGKSTLLGLISGIICPTSGSVKTDGRTSTILELGAGLRAQGFVEGVFSRTPNPINHLDQVIYASGIVFAELQAARHLKQVIQGDPAARVLLALPLGYGSPLIQSELSLLH